MNASDIVAFLSGDLSAVSFQAKIDPEVQSWAKKLSERGRSASVLLHGMGQLVDVTPEGAARLLNAYIKGELTAASFCYVLDALLLEERFRWTSVSAREVMEHVLGSEYPNKLDKRRAWQARAELNGLTET